MELESLFDNIPPHDRPLQARSIPRVRIVTKHFPFHFIAEAYHLVLGDMLLFVVHIFLQNFRDVIHGY